MSNFQHFGLCHRSTRRLTAASLPIHQWPSLVNASMDCLQWAQHPLLLGICLHNGFHPKAHDTRMRKLCELTHSKNLYVCHTDLQQDISRASFSHQIERVLFCASFSCEFLVWVSRASVMGLMPCSCNACNLILSAIEIFPVLSAMSN